MASVDSQRARTPAVKDVAPSVVRVRLRVNGTDQAVARLLQSAAVSWK